MKIKKGDNVKLLSGKDKGKTGKVLQVFPAENKISVEGLNLAVKHLRPSRQGEKGQRVEFPAWMSASKVMVLCEKCGKATRIGSKIIKNEQGRDKKYRLCLKCQQTLD